MNKLYKLSRLQRSLPVLAILVTGNYAYTQSTDTLKARMLNQVTVKGVRASVVEEMPAVKGTYLTAGKRNEVIKLADVDVNVAEKNARQVFARIPGVFVYDMDGTGPPPVLGAEYPSERHRNQLGYVRLPRQPLLGPDGKYRPR